MSNRAESPDFVSNDETLSTEFTLDPRVVKLTTRTGIDIQRTLPHRRIRTIGAWCFVDSYGPTDQVDAMSVAAHPHTGLQTVSWLFSGEVEHRDSLGNIQQVKPGELNLMTAGHGIAHSEISLNNRSQLHGVQLWTVLPDQHRDASPSFEHHGDLPVLNLNGIEIRLFIGELLGVRSPATIYAPLVAAEIDIRIDSHTQIPTDVTHEYGVLVVSGSPTVNGNSITVGQLHFVPAGRAHLSLASERGAKILLLGGQPFAEKIVMWWNFIARSHEEIVSMREDWQSQNQRFPSFADRIGGRIPAPAMPNLRLNPRANLT